jgi:hypothetical protein
MSNIKKWDTCRWNIEFLIFQFCEALKILMYCQIVDVIIKIY